MPGLWSGPSRLAPRGALTEDLRRMDWLAVSSLVVSGLLILVGFKAKKFAGSRDWPTTEGEITSSKIFTGWSAYGSSYSWVDICYEYSVNGISHSGVGIVNPSRLGRKRIAQAYLSLHPPGAPVLVYYDPNNPQIATHQPSPRGDHVVLWMLGVAAAGFGFRRILGFFGG